MKRESMLLLLLFTVMHADAQTWSEWFRQRRTQIRYLVNQIAALQVYIEFAQEGYKIVDQGLNLLGDIKQADFRLHKDFFDALKVVNPRIKNSEQVAGIFRLQSDLAALRNTAMQRADQSAQLSADERKYVQSIYNRLLQQTGDNIDELTTLITSGQYVLSDDERIQRINSLHADMQEKYRFAAWFNDQTINLAINRSNELKDVRVGESLIRKEK